MARQEQELNVTSEIPLPEVATEAWDRFRASGKPMTPAYLKEYIPGYSAFVPICADQLNYHGMPLLWGRREITPLGTEKRLVALLGATGVGKDTVVSYMMHHAPGLLQQIITHTSRTPRGGAEMYELVSREDFEKLLEARQILEYIRLGKEPDIAYYGMTKGAAAKALASSAAYALWRGEVVGWRNGVEPEIPTEFPEHRVGMVAVAILTPMPLDQYEKMVQDLRGKEGALWRIPRAMQEMQAFADPAFDVSYIILNPRTETGIPEPAGEALTLLLEALAGGGPGDK